MSSFLQGLERCDGFECDLQVLKDKSLIVLHDEYLQNRGWFDAAWLLTSTTPASFEPSS